ncbi:probable E3 ubiquitin-protein ligase ZFP1 [Telopea speciosissima]|uniref:probable E3 ubiquitin-protein ligase ZFP1 n=1 Tax=Telopea speciosissima TaxID=54955 RepID=UPI001CC65150|nr:probable E3 ubiquitin-protein ligase ZFP1 [Telopea speciosissima]XP_043704250.1 probable E3 ubiquitin-protein ligase ZFP1 [Telopea speciosissima]XP_043704251.1 probable E3 ubiquitin-protein ligase ZFP1 [Telopea speciosissima]XP_043704252.1 probable E3 ubiquitin-protein ligase ZFP1 [Telopea speciosissima]XP_043704254.1 probable E3 ubiquitin-protein ligase ZFP1 [Telopea speciosissima]XP_043704255.1 probable E3 ubiquitin-protein ligase ZFP1 [Telopea speciosissima]XP_043704256.1 probable E3 ub
MGHRHLFGKSQLFDMEPDQSRNHIPAEQPFVHLGRVGHPENGSVVFPVESISTTGVTSASQWNSASRSNDYPSSSISMEVPHYRPASGGSSYDPFLQPSAVGSYCPASQNYTHHASSSSYYRDTIHGVEGSAVNPTVGGGRGSRKRKSPAISMVCERGSSSRYYNTGSSSDVRISPNVQQEKPNLHSQHWVWDPISINSSYRGGSLSIGNEGSQRNVRSRSALDLEANLARTHLSSSVSRHPHSSGYPIDHSGMMDLARLGVNATTQEWSHNSVSPAARGIIPALDTTSSSHETNQFLGVCNGNGSVEIGGYQNDCILSRNPAIPPQNLHGNPIQAVRSGRSGYYQSSSTPAYRASLSYPRLGHITYSSEDVLQLASETYSSRYLRSSSTVGWRSNDRNGRSRIPYERFRSLSDEAGARGRLVSEGLMIDRSAFYGSRNLFDQHREMRLDVDNMSYEELVALGERIGSVNTGLSGDTISKCMTETIYCSSDQIQEEEGTCVICLEGYKDREEVGTLNNCSHDYHVNCIKKWLSMKNVCPICKTPALTEDDDSKDE